MEKSTIIKGAITMAVITLQTTMGYSQWTPVWSGGTNFLRTNALTRGLSVGNFGAPPLSALHINTNSFPA